MAAEKGVSSFIWPEGSCGTSAPWKCSVALEKSAKEGSCVTSPALEHCSLASDVDSRLWLPSIRTVCGVGSCGAIPFLGIGSCGSTPVIM